MWRLMAGLKGLLYCKVTMFHVSCLDADTGTAVALTSKGLEAVYNSLCRSHGSWPSLVLNSGLLRYSFESSLKGWTGELTRGIVDLRFQRNSNWFAVAECVDHRRTFRDAAVNRCSSCNSSFFLVSLCPYRLLFFASLCLHWNLTDKNLFLVVPLSP